MAERQGGSMEEESLCDLIPGLPDEVALLCLARLPFAHHALFSCVCRSWRHALRRPLLFDIRSRLGFEEHFLFVLMREKFCTFLVDSRLAKCYPVAPPPRLRGHPYVRCDVLALGRQVLILADRGSQSSDGPESCEPLCFDVVSRLWCTQPTPMLESRTRFASATVDGYVYAAGGRGDFYNLKSAERFDLASKKWGRIPDMTEKRELAAGVVWKGSFCLLGGWHLTTTGYDLKHDSAEVWDALKEEWQLIPGIWPCDMFSVASVKGKLYAHRYGHGKEVMLLDEKRNHWIPLESMTGDLQGHADHQLIGVGDELCMLAKDAHRKCILLATDPESLPLCWRLLPFCFDSYPSNVCVVTL